MKQITDEIRKSIIPFLRDRHNIKVEKSLNKDFNWFVPLPMGELPKDADDLSDEEYQETCGAHLKNDKELISFARELGYINCLLP
jgi:hypothetical protein